ncbi:DNA polymerase III subunit gamma/tau [Acinetobacter sp. CAAS 2-6]|uniref:DNA polymerase III subunit gamma/tau n=1 Tax=Acinetobacter sp. CAAS 2-6 TaxID=3016358 RepID=UPI002DD629CB|nr:DNA polymerase III subunit gamma/tau [Acinetobacter sp. CAAS 2-6]
MYQVLARKYRPRNFNELVGQNHVSRALTSALERGRLHHAYLFTGTRGVGKTTIARILAKCLNCETGVTSTPCEVCSTCKAVNEGRFIDLIEIDAASRTKVEDTRELLDNVPYAPTQGRFKVYLIDEVHMLSTHSFNALLKTLEEPPEHVKFLFATTDPQKLPITVISRCLQFTLRPLAVDEITEHLTQILAKEQIVADQDAIWQIAESAQGSLRDALSLTDQAIAYGQGEVHHQDVKEMLGLIDRSIIYDLILAIHQNQQQRVSQLLMQFRQQALDVSLVLDQLISTLHELALMQYLPDLSLKYSEEINKKIRQLAQLISAQDLQLYYQIACKGRSELQLAVTQEQGFEMCVLRLLAFRPLQPNEMLVTEQSTQAPVPTETVTAETAPAPDSTGEVEQIEAPIKSDENFADSIPPTVSEGVSIPDQPPAQVISFDPDAPDGLIDFDVMPSDQNNPPVLEHSAVAEDTEDFWLAPEALQPIGHSESAPLEQQVPQDFSPVQSLEDQSSAVEPVADLFAATPNVVEAELPNTHPLDQQPQIETEVSVSASSSEKSELLPQQILQLAPQELNGEWTVEKWEYWFRNSDLSPALQELAQQGVMSGEINGVSVFHIPQEYENLLSQQQQSLQDALAVQWPETRFSVQYGTLEQTTPYMMQNVRKEKAYQRAAELLQQEPAVQKLIELFDAEIQNIQLKP